MTERNADVSKTLTEKWINIYKHKNSYWCGTPNHTKSEALLHLADTENYLTTVNIEQLLKLQEQNTKLKGLLRELKRYFDKGGKYYIEKRILLKSTKY